MKRTNWHASRVDYTIRNLRSQDERELFSKVGYYHSTILRSRSLLILPNDIMLRASLGSLSIIMPLPRTLFALSISQRTSHGAPNAAFHSFPNSRAIIPQLAFGLLALAFSILALSLLFEPVGAYSVPDCFFGGANGLVVRALGAVRVVCRYAAGWRDGDGTEFAD